MSDIYGRNAVREALQNQTDINRITVARSARHGIIDDIFRLAKAQGVPISIVERKVLDQRFPAKNHQGVAASLTENARYVDLDEIFRRAEETGEPPLFVLLDDIEDPHNLGAILRNADAFGAHGVIIGRHRSASLTEGAVKAASGAAEHVAVARVANISQTIRILKERGVWVCGTEAGAPSMYGVPLDGPLALVIGNEGRGMSRLVREHCDFMCAIPMGGHVGSLNASVAAGILLSEIRRQRVGVS